MPIDKKKKALLDSMQSSTAWLSGSMGMKMSPTDHQLHDHVHTYKPMQVKTGMGKTTIPVPRNLPVNKVRPHMSTEWLEEISEIIAGTNRRREARKKVLTTGTGAASLANLDHRSGDSLESTLSRITDTGAKKDFAKSRVKAGIAKRKRQKKFERTVTAPL